MFMLLPVVCELSIARRSLPAGIDKARSKRMR
jgi:hypothetical protein